MLPKFQKTMRQIITFIFVFILISFTVIAIPQNNIYMKNYYSIYDTLRFNATNITAIRYCIGLECITSWSEINLSIGGSFTNNSDISVNYLNVSSINLSGEVITSWDDVNISVTEYNDDWINNTFYTMIDVDTLITGNISTKDECSEISGCVVGALTSESDPSWTANQTSYYNKTILDIIIPGNDTDTWNTTAQMRTAINQTGYYYDIQVNCSNIIGNDSENFCADNQESGEDFVNNSDLSVRYLNVTIINLSGKKITSWDDVNGSWYYPNATINSLITGNLSTAYANDTYEHSTLRSEIDNNASQFYPNATVDALITGNMTNINNSDYVNFSKVTLGTAIAPTESGSLNMSGNLTVIGGSIGIGTSSPTALLEVYGATGNGRALLNLYHLGNSNYQFVGDDTNNYLELKSQSANTIMVWNRAGNVGIGTAAPDYSLTVNGTGLNISNSTETAKLCLNGVCYTSLSSSSFTNNSDISVNYLNASSINLSGKKITSWDDINGSWYYPNATVNSLITGNLSTAYGNDTFGHSAIFTAMTGNLSLAYANDTWGNGKFNSTSWNRTGTNVVLANTGDNVGIGGTPTEKLTVIGDLSIKNATSSAAYYKVNISDDGGSNYMVENFGRWAAYKYTYVNGVQAALLYSANNTNSTSLTLRAPLSQLDRIQLHTNGTTYFTGGYVGIGTNSPAQMLDVNGNIRITNNPSYLYFNTSPVMAYTNDRLRLGGVDASTKNLSLETNNAERMRITDTGKVGIGTINPDYSLTVNGTGLNVSNSSLTAKLCLNGNCATSLGTVTSVGTGDGLTGGTITTAGTISLSSNVSERINWTTARSQAIISGGGTIQWNTTNQNLSWTVRFIWIPVDKRFDAGGYLQANASSIVLEDWNGLYAVCNPTTIYCTIETRYYNDASEDTDNWFLIATRNGDTGKITFADGTTMDDTITTTITNGLGEYNQGGSPYLKNLKIAPANANGILYWGSTSYSTYMSNADPDLGGVTDYSITNKMTDTNGRGFRWINENEVGMTLESYTNEWDLTVQNDITAVSGVVSIGTTTNTQGPGSLNMTGNLTVDSTTLFVNAQNDKVGIGTANPTRQLQVEGNATVTNMINTTYLNLGNITSPSNSIALEVKAPRIKSTDFFGFAASFSSPWVSSTVDIVNKDVWSETSALKVTQGNATYGIYTVGQIYATGSINTSDILSTADGIDLNQDGTADIYYVAADDYIRIELS